MLPIASSIPCCTRDTNLHRLQRMQVGSFLVAVKDIHSVPISFLRVQSGGARFRAHAPRNVGKLHSYAQTHIYRLNDISRLKWLSLCPASGFGTASAIDAVHTGDSSRLHHPCRYAGNDAGRNSNQPAGLDSHERLGHTNLRYAQHTPRKIGCNTLLHIAQRRCHLC